MRRRTHDGPLSTLSVGLGGTTQTDFYLSTRANPSPDRYRESLRERETLQPHSSLELRKVGRAETGNRVPPGARREAAGERVRLVPNQLRLTEYSLRVASGVGAGGNIVERGAPRGGVEERVQEAEGRFPSGNELVVQQCDDRGKGWGAATGAVDLTELRI
jgi:hypothetical protein